MILEIFSKIWVCSVAMVGWGALLGLFLGLVSPKLVDEKLFPFFMALFVAATLGIAVGSVGMWVGMILEGASRW